MKAKKTEYAIEVKTADPRRASQWVLSYSACDLYYGWFSKLYFEKSMSKLFHDYYRFKVGCGDIREPRKLTV